jgi:flagellar hook-associated protein 1
MSGITSVLNLAGGALMANQTGMSVAGHNIANVNTLGYTRQRLIMESNAVASSTRLKLGMGVKADEVTQDFDQFTTRSINQNASQLSEFESKRSILDNVQGIFNETNDSGLTKRLQEFWSSWQNLSNNPGGIPERTVVLQNAQSLCDQFHTMNQSLVQARSQMSGNLGVALNDLNTLTGQVAQLNKTIVASEASGTLANDQRDQRNSLIEKISRLVDINYLEGKDGSVMIMAKSGVALVDGNQSWKLTQQGDAIQWNNVPNDISNQLTGGKIGAWIDLRDSIIPQYEANLNELAGTIINEVNTQHLAGYALDNSTNHYFFNPFNIGCPQYGATYAGDKIVSVGGSYSGDATKTFDFTVHGSGTVGTDSFTLDWNDGTGLPGHSGTLSVTPENYSNLTVFDGIQISLAPGNLVDGDAFSVNVTDNAGAASSIALSSDMKDHPANIAASGVPAVPGVPEPGNNENALALQALQAKAIEVKKWTYQRGVDPSSQNQSGTMDDYYSILVGDIGILTEDTSQKQDFAQTMDTQLNNTRDSISGVNLDEETINLMKYQQAFSAASRLVSVADQMLQDILNMR